jgi:steroid 5-alpha reductase family enzyme
MSENSTNTKQNNIASLLAVPIVVLVGVALAFVGSAGGKTLSGLPVFAICVAIAFAIQWIVVLPFYLLQTEKYFDLIGSLTHISVVIFALFASRQMDLRAMILTLLIMIWALRLGIFLFTRILHDGGDDRWDDLKKSFPTFLMTWTLQGLWVVFTQAAALAAITSETTPTFGLFAIVGVLIWAFGFGFEVVADWQKRQFRAKPENKNRFITTGLWAYSRHPNYFGEIVLWIGIALIAFPALQGWQYVTLLSPLFVIVLLTRISGIPMLEAKAKKKWGGQADYQDYKQSTPVLIPRL